MQDDLNTSDICVKLKLIKKRQAHFNISKTSSHSLAVFY